MSRELERFEKPFGVRSIVVDSRGKFFSIDTDDTYDAGPETMVCKYNQRAHDVTNWKDLYVRRYGTMAQAMEGHQEVVENLEHFLYG